MEAHVMSCWASVSAAGGKRDLLPRMSPLELTLGAAITWDDEKHSYVFEDDTPHMVEVSPSSYLLPKFEEHGIKEAYCEAHTKFRDMKQKTMDAIDVILKEFCTVVVIRREEGDQTVKMSTLSNDQLIALAEMWNEIVSPVDKFCDQEEEGIDEGEDDSDDEQDETYGEGESDGEESESDGEESDDESAKQGSDSSDSESESGSEE